MTKVTVGGIIKTAIVSAFTIAAALIWKDVITDSIGIIFPGEELLYKLITAIIATIIVVIAIYLILRAQAETEVVLRKIKDTNSKIKRENKKGPNKDIQKLRKGVQIIR